MDEFTRERIARAMRQATRIVVLTGAGISTSAGIKDFRGKDGMYEIVRKRYNLPSPEAIFEINFFMRQPEPFYEMVRSMFAMEAEPTLSHRFLAWLEEQGKMSLLVTQNIDMLHHKAGSKAVLECHGTLRTASCLTCGRSFEFAEIRAAVLAGGIPRCECQGLIKPDIVFFGESLPAEFYTVHLSPPDADLLLLMGTSLNVQPAAGFALNLAATTESILVNRDPTPYDAMVTHVVNMDLDRFCQDIWEEMEKTPS
ncbi:MAG: silent information regulator protein Sir2 [Deltaproteobacteria bacterium]|nr:MAG: silent information regulator protein Sir2 [Deltaproteobacteria bacterium]